VLKHSIGLHSQGVSLWVMAARVKTEKSKRRPGKSAHALDIKPACAAVHAATIRSKELASCYSRPKSVSSTPAVQLAPLPSRLSWLRRPDAGRGGADSTVKYWVKLNKRDRVVDGAGMSGSNVGLSLFACTSVRRS